MAKKEKIESLTPEQEIQMREFRDEWRKIALATGEANIEAITPVINNFYRRMGLKEPKIWRCSSPLMIELISKMLNDNFSDEVMKNFKLVGLGILGFYQSFFNSIVDNMWKNIEENIRLQFREEFSNPSNVSAFIISDLSSKEETDFPMKFNEYFVDNFLDNILKNMRENLEPFFRYELMDKLTSVDNTNLTELIEANLKENESMKPLMDLDENIPYSDFAGKNISDNLAKNLSDNLAGNFFQIFLGNLHAVINTSTQSKLKIPVIEQIGNEVFTNLIRNLENNILEEIEETFKHNLLKKLTDNIGNNTELSFENGIPNIAKDNLSKDIFSKVVFPLTQGLGKNIGENITNNSKKIIDNVSFTTFEKFISDIDEIMHAIQINIMAAINSAVRSKLETLRFRYHGTWLWGSMDAYWIAHYLFPHLYIRKIHTDEQMEELYAWETIAKNCFWWYPYKDVCFVSDRPTRICTDAQWRLHSEYTPAVEFSDGYKLYALNGVTLPAWIIEHPEEITPEKIDKEKNAEIRRIMIKRYGFKKYCEKKDAKLIDKNPNDIFGELWQFEDKDGVIIQFVHCMNGTAEDGINKWYDLRVRPVFTNVVEAIASTYPGITMDEFLLMSNYRS